MRSDSPCFRNWWHPVGDSGAEYLPEYSPVRLWPEVLMPREQPEARPSAGQGRGAFFAWWVAPVN
jgi:hypothetical protein